MKEINVRRDNPSPCETKIPILKMCTINLLDNAMQQFLKIKNTLS